MFTIKGIKEKKVQYGYSNARLAKESGVPLSTVQKVLGNVTTSPRFETIKALSAVFEKLDEETKYRFERGLPVINEASHKYDMNDFNEKLGNSHYYDRQGTYTIDDYLALPDEQRVELIDGVFYDMSSPTMPHQLIGGAIHAQIVEFIRTNKGKCVPFIAPADVQLDCEDEKTIVQPDVMVVCDRSKINRNRIYGAPDFIVEVLSPSTKKKDLFVKLKKYSDTGVKEYWMIDPMKKTVCVYDFSNDESIKLYSFEDEIPVNIYNGKLKINMKEIADYISFID